MTTEVEVEQVWKIWREKDEEIGRNIVSKFLGTLWGYSDLVIHLNIDEYCPFAKVVKAVIDHNADIKIVLRTINVTMRRAVIGDYVGSYSYGDGITYDVYMQVNKSIPAVYLHMTYVITGDRFRDFLIIIRPKS